MRETAETREREIIESLLGRDGKGMDALLLYYGPLIRYVIAPILDDPQDREDCLSETLTRVCEKIGQFDRKRGSFRAWLTAIARNTAYNRKRSIAREDGVGEISEDVPSPEPTPEEALIQKERREAVSRALSQLSSRDRTLFYRKYYYCQPISQIASETGMTERAVEGKLYRLKKRLRRMLEGVAHE